MSSASSKRRRRNNKPSTSVSRGDAANCKLKKYAKHIKHLISLTPKQRVEWLRQYCNRDFVNCFSEIAYNLLSGRVALTPQQKQNFHRHKQYLKQLKALASSKTSVKKKANYLVQRGGFLGAILAPIASVLGSLLFSN